MTSIMPYPKSVTLDQAFKPLLELQKAVDQSAGKDKIPGGARDAFADFHTLLDRGASFSEAVSSLIRDQDGGPYYPMPLTMDAKPRGVGPSGSGVGDPQNLMPPPWLPPMPNEAKNYFDQVLFNMAYTLDEGMRNLEQQVLQATKDNKLDAGEANNIRAFIKSSELVKKNLAEMVQDRAKLGGGFDAMEPWQIYDKLLSQVNKKSNDITGGPFGSWYKFQVGEAKAFVTELQNAQVSPDKAREVLRELFYAAESKYGNMVLDKAASEVLMYYAKDVGGLEDLDWKKTINVKKEEHPIVALYAVSIRDAIDNESEPRRLNHMLRAAEAAHNDLSADFVRHGPRTLGGAALSASSATASFAGASAVGNRANAVNELGAAIQELRARIGELG